MQPRVDPFSGYPRSCQRSGDEGSKSLLTAESRRKKNAPMPIGRSLVSQSQGRDCEKQAKQREPSWVHLLAVMLACNLVRLCGLCGAQRHGYPQPRSTDLSRALRVGSQQESNGSALESLGRDRGQAGSMMAILMWVNLRIRRLSTSSCELVARYSRGHTFSGVTNRKRVGQSDTSSLRHAGQP